MTSYERRKARFLADLARHGEERAQERTDAACPRCGSDDPAVLQYVRGGLYLCDDDWHDRPTDTDRPTDDTDHFGRVPATGRGSDGIDRPTDDLPALLADAIVETLTDRPIDDLCSVCGETHEPPECRIGGPMTDRPTDDGECNHDDDGLWCSSCRHTDDLPVWLDVRADTEAQLGYPIGAAQMRRAAARIRELEADCARLADAAQGLMMLKEDALARIRELEAAEDALKDAAARAVAELYAEHDKDDKLPWCRICGTADGSWPCITRMVADELMEAIR